MAKKLNHNNEKNEQVVEGVREHRRSRSRSNGKDLTWSLHAIDRLRFTRAPTLIALGCGTQCTFFVILYVYYMFWLYFWRIWSCHGLTLPTRGHSHSPLARGSLVDDTSHERLPSSPVRERGPGSSLLVCIAYNCLNLFWLLECAIFLTLINIFFSTDQNVNKKRRDLNRLHDIWNLPPDIFGGILARDKNIYYNLNQSYWLEEGRPTPGEGRRGHGLFSW